MVRTLSIPDAYKLIRYSFGFMSGYSLPDVGAFASLHKTSRTLVAGLGANIGDPHAVDLALENHRRIETPHPRTFSRTDKEVRSYAVVTTLPNFASLIPESIDDLRWSDVTLPATELSFARELAEWGAPVVADPEILEAWSKTTFLRKKPEIGELVGPLFASTTSLPFRRPTL